jgi:hypothetical protein
MVSRAPVALAIGAGYVLGRTHRLRWAMILGAAAASGRLNGISGQALERGLKTLRSTPELAKMADSAERLLEAGRAAAVSAMSSRVESMGDKLEGRTEALTSAATDRARPGKSRDTDEQAEGDDTADYHEPADQDEEEDDYDEEEDDEEEDDEDDEDEDQDSEQAEDDQQTATRGKPRREPATTGGRRPSAPQGGRPVDRKTGR